MSFLPLAPHHCHDERRRHEQVYVLFLICSALLREVVDRSCFRKSGNVIVEIRLTFFLREIMKTMMLECFANHH